MQQQYHKQNNSLPTQHNLNNIYQKHTHNIQKQQTHKTIKTNITKQHTTNTNNVFIIIKHT